MGLEKHGMSKEFWYRNLLENVHLKCREDLEITLTQILGRWVVRLPGGGWRCFRVVTNGCNC